MARSAKITQGTWSYYWFMDPVEPLETILDNLASFGYHGVGIASYGHCPLEQYPDKSSRQELVRKINDKGLEISAYVGDYYSAPFADGDPAMWQRYTELFDASMQFCEDCGIQNARVDTVSPSPLAADIYEKTYERVVKMFQRCAKVGADHGVQINWEMESGFIINRPSDVVRLLKDVDHPNFKFAYDPSHAQASAVLAHKQTEPIETLPGGQLEFIGMVKGYIGDVHIIDTDNTICRDTFGTHLAFGKGMMNFDEIIPAVLDAGYEGEWWTFDLIDSDNAWEETREGAGILNELLDRHVRK